MPVDWGLAAAAGVTGIIQGITSWLMDDSEDEEKARELDAQLDREKRRLPPWAYARLKGLLTGSVTPSGTAGGGGEAPAGSFQRVLGQEGGGEAPPGMGAGGGMGAGIGSRVRPRLGGGMLPERNQQLRTFLGGR